MHDALGNSAKVTPSKSVLTEFETPTGVASVRGTILTVAYEDGVTEIDLEEGVVDFTSTGDEVNFEIETGDSVNVSVPESGQASVSVDSLSVGLSRA